jgi:hypothetical protein
MAAGGLARNGRGVATRILFPIFSENEGKKMKMGHGWQFLSCRWWLMHFLGFSLVYAAGRLTALLFKG